MLDWFRSAFGRCTLVAGTLLIAGYWYSQSGAGPSVAQAAAKPNIVVFMIDDLDVRSLDTLLARGMLPNIQSRVINRGSSYYFSESFVTRAQCCPSRATFLTGQYAHNHSVWTNDPPYGGVGRFNDTSTIATWLRTAGYRTGLVGKYLNGYGSTTAQNYVPPGWDDWQGLLDFTSSRPYHFNVNDNGSIIQHTQYNTDVMASRAADFIRESNTAQPFFLYVAPSAPHLSINPQYNACAAAGASPWEFTNVPIELLGWGHTVYPAPRHQGRINGNTTLFPLPMPPSFNEPDISDKPAWYRNFPMSAADIDCLQKNYWHRLESMLGIDELVGAVDLELSKKQVGSNTIVILTSDNGFMLGEHRLLHKGQAFEESIRVPLYIAHSGAAGPRTISRLALNNDLAPTIAAFAGVTPPANHVIDGRSLLPVLGGATPAVWRKRFLIEHWSTLPSVAPADYFAVRTGVAPLRKLVDYPKVVSDTTREYYDLGIDSYEMNNLKGRPDRQAEISVLADFLNRLRVCAGPSCVAIEDQQ